MISTRRKDKDKESIIIEVAMQQKKLWEKYFSANDSRTKLECISKLHDLTLALANLLQYDDYRMQSEIHNHNHNRNLYNHNYNYKKSSPLKIGKLSNSPNTRMILSRFVNNNDEDLR